MVYETNIKDNSNTQDNICAQKWTKQTNTGEEATATITFPGLFIVVSREVLRTWERGKCISCFPDPSRLVLVSLLIEGLAQCTTAKTLVNEPQEPS